ncbi:MAG: acetyl-CoA carboxylase biotin carboxyl carrier protein [Alphaproteobacteria bacterium]|jgi:acetyl-CoA carboxylase biotin carboxyl carrier protein|nr:acetyl-CoA carboxylase biotin carboxyl carrier protein [Alphaproteobacteria bacterium]
MKIDPKTIKELAKLLEQTGLTEIEVAEGDKVIRVSKGATAVVSSGAVSAHSMPSDPTQPQAANMSAPDNVAHAHPGAVTSPMVGTAYLKPSPDAATFVQKGSTVKAGDTLLIIEAMKVMNPIKAEKGGTITHIMIENGKPVEYGDVLMVIE